MPPLTDRRRRALLRALAWWPLTALAAPAWAQAAADRAGLVSPNVCLLSPETTAGPFYLDPRLVRAAIAEGRPGVPLDLALQVVDTACRPIADARIDVWHCDADGDYSGFARQGNRSTEGETFLRGTQFTDPDGVVRFQTIWPGWYRGRTPHIHVKVILGDTATLTTQMFFPDGTSEALYRAAPAYRDRAAAQDTDNARDGIARAAGPAAIARVAPSETGLAAALVLGLDPDA